MSHDLCAGRKLKMLTIQPIVCGSTQHTTDPASTLTLTRPGSQDAQPCNSTSLTHLDGCARLQQHAAHDAHIRRVRQEHRHRLWLRQHQLYGACEHQLRQAELVLS